MELRSMGADTIDKNQWSEFVKNHPEGNVFQTPEMYEVFDKTKKYQALFIASVNESKEIYGVMVSTIQKEYGWPLGSLTSRCVCIGGPLIKHELERNDKLEILNFLLKEQNKIARKKAIYMQFRNFRDTRFEKPVFEQNGYEFEDHLNIRIDLTPSEDELFEAMKKDKRKAIKKAESNNLRLITVESKQDINYFYDMLKETYKDARVPLADLSFFNLIYDLMVTKGMANYYLADLDGKYIGGRLELYYNNTIFDLYAGDINDFTTYYPNEFILWNVLKSGKKNGFRTFDFMGAGKPDEEYGVRDWKIRFGGKLYNDGRYQNIYKKTKMKIAKTGLDIYKKVK